MTFAGRLLSWGIDGVGSSRSSALIRIGLGFLIWARFGFAMHPIHAPGELIFRVAFFACTLALVVGWLTRWACAGSALLLGVIYFYQGKILGSEVLSAHHIYLLFSATFLLTFAPAGKSYSIDRWVALRRAEREGRPRPAERGNLLGLRLISLQIAAVYLWGALGKLTPGYLSGERLQHYFHHFYAGFDFGRLPGFELACLGIALGTVLLEFLLSGGLFFAPTRKFLLPTGVAFHLLIYVTFPVLTFSLTMILLYLAFIPANTIHRTIDRLQLPGDAP